MLKVLDVYANLLDPLNSPLSFGPKFLPLNILVNVQKFGTMFFIMFMMWYHQNFSIGCYVYLAIHGSYGKDRL